MLTTLAKVKAELIATTTVQAADDALIFGYIVDVTKRMQGLSWNFEPYYLTEYITPCPEDINSYTGELTLTNRKGQLVLLASPTDVPAIVSGSSTLVYGTDVVANPQNFTPIRVLRFSQQLCRTWYSCTATGQFIDTISIAGFWGWRDYYDTQGFLASGDSVQDAAGINASVTSITVTSVTGVDYYFQTPRFSPGNLIRIENELCMIYSITGNVLSVRRGVNGSTAAAHALNTAISVFYPEEDIVQAATRWACYKYARRGAFDTFRTDGISSVSFPADMPREVLATLQGYSNI